MTICVGQSNSNKKNQGNTTSTIFKEQEEKEKAEVPAEGARRSNGIFHFPTVVFGTYGGMTADCNCFEFSNT